MFREQLIDSFIEVDVKTSDDFLKVKETLTRIGISNRDEDTLFQSCHIFHKKGRYYITHFKEMFALDGREVDFTDEDVARRNTIAKILEKWGLLVIVSVDNAASPILAGRNALTIIPFSKKKEWNLEAKYSIGGNKTRN